MSETIDETPEAGTEKLELYDWQQDLLDAVIAGETGYTIVNVPRGAGKSTIGKVLMQHGAHVFMSLPDPAWEGGMPEDFSDVHTFVFDDVKPPEEWIEFLNDRLVIYLRSPDVCPCGNDVCAGLRETALNQLTIEQDFIWDGEAKTLTYGEQKFSWMPDWKLPDWATGRVFYFSTLGSPEALNKARFDEANKNRVAGSLVGAPLNMNHKRYDLVGQNIIVDTEVNGERLEGICYVEDPAMLAEYDAERVIGCSIDYKDRNKKSEDYDVEGAFGLGLAWVTKPYVCGYPDSLVWEATRAPEDVEIEIKTMSSNLEITSETMKTMSESMMDLVDKELLDQRTVIFQGYVGGHTCAELTKVLEYLGSVSDGPIKVLLNSGGGSVYAGLLVFETIERLTDRGIEVTCEVRGLAASMGAIILQAGTHRIATPNTRFLIHEVSSWAWGKTSEMEDEIKEIKKVNDLLKSIIAERVGKTVDEIDAVWHKKDVWLSAEEALEFGLIDEIVEGESKTQTYIDSLTEEVFSWLNSVEMRLDGLQAKSLSATEVFKRLEKEEEEEDADDEDVEDEETKTLTLDGGEEGDDSEPVVASPSSKPLGDDCFAFIEAGGEHRHLQFRDEDGYDEVLLIAAMNGLKQMTFDGEISKSASEAARHQLIEGFRALELDIPEWASGIDGLENRVNVKHLAFLMRNWKRQAGFRDRYNSLRGDDDGGEGKGMHPQPSTSVPTRKEREMRGNRPRRREG